jgi:hypothetical protein
MISQGRLCPVFEAAPRWVVAISEVFSAPLFVGQVASGKNRPRDLLDQFGCRSGAFRIFATADVACTDENKSSLGRLLLGRFVTKPLGSIG